MTYKLYDNNNLDSSLSHECSLILTQDTNSGATEASIVSWVKPYRKCEGRIVNLDDSGSIIYPSHFSGKTSFQKFYMIAPGVGARVRKQCREQVPPWAVRLQLMHNIISDGGIAQELSSPKCVVCERYVVNGSPVRRCAFCQLYLHNMCAQLMANLVQTFRTTNGLQFMSELGIEPQHVPFSILLLP